MASSPNLFLVQITSDADAPSYTWVEVWDDGTGALVALVGGRYGSAANLGVAVDDYALCRSAAGNGGRVKMSAT